MDKYRIGIDIGSTTVKVVFLNEKDQIIYSDYKRHMARIQETLASLLQEGRKLVGPCRVRPVITGSGGLNLSRLLCIPFAQEVVAVATALEKHAPQTDVAIELGGEDAKIIYFTGGVDQRMNGICAGGTGSFIDQMASLLQTDASGLNEYAKNYKAIYPIAARCGVFAKSDIQPLINEGASKEDLSASIFQAVVNQTISGLACGKPIRGKVAFLGGPLHFLTELRAAFVRTLGLAEQETIVPDNSHLFAALGAAMNPGDETELDDLIDRLSKGVSMDFEIKRLSPLFKDEEEYGQFKARHEKHRVRRGDISSYEGPCYLGIDAGSTTTKLALVGLDGELLYSFYDNNNGSPLATSIRAVKELKDLMGSGAYIAGSCSTGYGEALLKSAFMLDEGEVETISHYYAASFFDPNVDCILDIGGQDMKCIKIKDRAVDSIMLNEACSSGCGSFIENFANSMGYSVKDFAKEALYAKNPVDLGTRCTVFMNSNVKQAQKEGAPVSDISAGLAYSVIKNALYKVIKISDAKDLGKNIVVQGGTFYNDAVLRSFELTACCEAIRPDIAGIMGAFGAALIARERCGQDKSAMLSLDEITGLEYSSSLTRCKGCENHCLLTINHFPGGRNFISGNRCEKGLGKTKASQSVPNVFEYKYHRIFDYEPLPENEAKRGTIGMPRALNIYENYPFWAVFFKKLGFRLVLSPASNRKIYELGMESIPSESECYPAKLTHGHVQWLINNGIKNIFYPCVFYERVEKEGVQNHFNCPMVIAYPENIKHNLDDIKEKNINYMRPFMSFENEKVLSKRLEVFFKKYMSIPEKETAQAVLAGWEELLNCRRDIQKKGEEVVRWCEENSRHGVVVAGRPYHDDPEVNHGIPELIASYGIAVFTEDSVSHLANPERPIIVNDQWTFHSRLYAAAQYVKQKDFLDLIQLNSFGCGLDAVTVDQVSDILTGSGKIYTVLKIDEVNNLGAARIRIRSLLSAIRIRQKDCHRRVTAPSSYDRAVFTPEMRDAGYTILAPQMSPIHFDMLVPTLNNYGYNIEIPNTSNKEAIDLGLKYVNNDACYPSLIVVGQFMSAVLSGKYDTDRLAILITQTGGCCRASNYISFIRRALEKEGLGHIPVISLNANGMEKNPGFSYNAPMVVRALESIVYGDLFMRMVYRMRPYEKVKGTTDALHEKWLKICLESLLDKAKFGYRRFKENCRQMVREFDAIKIDEDMKKPRVGIVGEILVKFLPLANNDLVNLLEDEGAEAVMPDLLDFLSYCAFNLDYKAKYLGGSKLNRLIGNAAVTGIEKVRSAAVSALKNSVHFSAPGSIRKLAEHAKKYISMGNQYGEGWFLTGEMVELMEAGVSNIVCTQPFGCLPNHVCGKGVIKELGEAFEDSNIIAIDYDPGASEVNQLNRIKLMLSTAKKKLSNI